MRTIEEACNTDEQIELMKKIMEQTKEFREKLPEMYKHFLLYGEIKIPPEFNKYFADNFNELLS